MRTLTRLVLLTALALPLTAGDPAEAIVAHHAEGPVIQVALLLDDSGSMQGLINQARAQLWELVGLLGSTTRGGKKPRVEVALYHYGDLPALVAPLVPLSSDLDQVSERLFTINGGGGTEACGKVIQQATRQLGWRRGPDALRLIVIAGNEEFTQGDVDWRSAVDAARGSGIVVHTIHCGPRAVGVAGMWEAGARLGGGTFTCIDQDARAAVCAPQDDELAVLNQQLNATYIAYGAEGGAMRERQVAQDANAEAVGSLGSRAAAKASSAYENSSWDLVDAVRTKKIDVATAPAAQLPPELQGKTAEERTALVAAKERERCDIQSRIAALGAQRSAWVAAQQPDSTTLGDGLRAAVRAQAEAAGFTLAP